MNGHHHQTFLAPVLAIILFAGAPSFAEEPPCPKPDPLPISVMLLAPPCDDCEETAGELAELLKLQKLRTPDQAKHATDDSERTIGRFLDEIGIQIDDQLPVAGHLFKCIAEAAKDEIRDAKMTFHRTRPYKLPHNGLQFLKELKDDDSFSYPSGHATYGTIVGLVVAEMIPEKRGKIIKRIENYGFSRMVAGVHFRSDVYAGQVAGAAITTSLFRNEDFRNAFEKARAEVRQSLGY